MRWKREYTIKLFEILFQHLCRFVKKNNVQLFMTTHSLEAIDVLLEDCKEHLDDTVIYHIRKGEDKTIAKRYGGNKLLNLRNETGFDVR